MRWDVNTHLQWIELLVSIAGPSLLLKESYWRHPCNLVSNEIKVKVKVLIYSPKSRYAAQRTLHFTPRYRNSLSHSLVSLGKMQRIFCSLSHSQFSDLFHLVSITAGWTEARVWMQSLPKAFTLDRHRESNHGPLDLWSNALDRSSTRSTILTLM